MWGKKFAAIDDTPEVDAHQPLEILVAHLLDRACEFQRLLSVVLAPAVMRERREREREPGNEDDAS